VWCIQKSRVLDTTKRVLTPAADTESSSELMPGPLLIILIIVVFTRKLKPGRIYPLQQGWWLRRRMRHTTAQLYGAASMRLLLSLSISLLSRMTTLLSASSCVESGIVYSLKHGLEGNTRRTFCGAMSYTRRQAPSTSERSRGREVQGKGIRYPMCSMIRTKSRSQKSRGKSRSSIYLLCLAITLYSVCHMKQVTAMAR
jgi:hypothetical protein